MKRGELITQTSLFKITITTMLISDQCQEPFKEQQMAIKQNIDGKFAFIPPDKVQNIK